MRRHNALAWTLCVLLCLGLAVAISLGSPGRVLAATVGIALAAVVMWRTEYGVVIAMLALASIARSSAIPKPLVIGGQGLHLSEVLIVLMLVSTVCRSFVSRQRSILSSPMTIPVLCLCGSVVLSIVIALRSHEPVPSFSQIRGYTQPMFNYLLFFVVLMGIRTEQQVRTVIRGLTWIAVVVSLLMVVQHFLPSGRTIFFGTDDYVNSLSASIGDKPWEDVTRITPPGLALIVVFFLLSLQMAARGRTTATGAYTAAAALMGIGLVFSFYRSFWIATALGVAIVALMSQRAVRNRLVVALLVVVIASTAGGVFVGVRSSGAAGQHFVAAFRERVMSMFTQESFRTSSLQNRVEENRHALSVIRRNPVWGVGAGYPVYRRQIDNIRGRLFIAPYYWMHDSYLELWMVYGLAGLLSFIAVSTVFMVRCLQLFRISSGTSRAYIGAAFLAAYVGFLFRSITQMHVVHDGHHIAMVAVMWGLVEVLIRSTNECHGNAECVVHADESSL